MRLLNADELGAKGEARFQELCIDAQLIPNPSTRDRRGWDYVVDWPMSVDASLDTRPSALSALVQVKTVWSGSRSVKLRLSTIEYIAKALKPAFIYIVEISPDLRHVSSRIVHIADEVLTQILTSLRQARATSGSPSDVQISLPLGRWGPSIGPDGSSFRSICETMIGASMADYAVRKKGQLDGLGFEGGGMRIETMLAIKSREELIDGFLGLRSLDFETLTGSETRFNIELPVPHLNLRSGTLNITPEGQERCTITLHPHGDPMGAAVFSGTSDLGAATSFGARPSSYDGPRRSF